MSAAQQLLNSQASRDNETDESLWTKFTQQRLKAWQISIPPRCAIALYLLGGVAFFVLGFSLLLISWSVEEHTLDYTDFSRDALLSGKLTKMEIEVTKDMLPPIWVYYELEGFHQNHRRYVKSRDNHQLQAGKPISFEASDLRASCSPAVMGDAGRPLYPCGLVAHSVFNDTFAFAKSEPGEGKQWTLLDVDSSARTIAWPADVDGGKFANYNPEDHSSGLQNQEKLDMWLIQRFPPVACVQTSIAPSMRYKPLYVGTQEVATAGKGAGLQTVTVADCRGYFSEHPKCNFKDIDGNSVQCSGPEYKEVLVPDWGIASGHFMAWMRIAGLPNFRKLWGKIDEPLLKGTRLKVYVASHFVVEPFDGRKKVVISTSSSLGGRNDFLGKGYLLVGLCCFLFGAWFLWNHLSPAAS